MTEGLIFALVLVAFGLILVTLARSGVTRHLETSTITARCRRCGQTRDLMRLDPRVLHTQGVPRFDGFECTGGCTPAADGLPL